MDALLETGFCKDLKSCKRTFARNCAKLRAPATKQHRKLNSLRLQAVLEGAATYE